MRNREVRRGIYHIFPGRILVMAYGVTEENLVHMYDMQKEKSFFVSRDEYNLCNHVVHVFDEMRRVTDPSGLIKDKESHQKALDACKNYSG